jgi:hypothetical protein
MIHRDSKLYRHSYPRGTQKIRSGRGGSGNAHMNKPLPENTARIMARARDHEAELVAISALNATSVRSVSSGMQSLV